MLWWPAHAQRKQQENPAKRATSNGHSRVVASSLGNTVLVSGGENRARTRPLTEKTAASHPPRVLTAEGESERGVLKRPSLLCENLPGETKTV